MLGKKNAQLSIFVVIGAILVMVSLFLFFNSEFEFFQTYDTRLKNQVSDVVEGCLIDTANTGVFLLGFQGGVINIPENAEVPGRHVDFGLKIPNWDSEVGSIPTVISMQQELEDFVLEEAPTCIESNLDTLSEFLSIDIADTLTVEADINSENVILDVQYPITFSEANSEEVLTIEDFYVKLDAVRLGDMYGLASQIFSLEQGSTFMEDLILDQIFSAGDYSSVLSMPSQGMYFSCGERVWTLQQLQENLANLNNNNFKYLYFDGTYPIDDVFDANLEGVNGPESLREYYEKNYIFSLANTPNSYKNYRVEVIMPSTEVTGQEGILQRYPYREFSVNPSSGGIVKSMSLEAGDSLQIPVPCVQIYHHTYTLDYDLIVKVTDYNDDGNFYSFQFPLRMQVENNNPKRELGALPFTVEPTTATNDVYCTDESYEYPLQIYAVDTDNNPIRDAEISYKCINLQCSMGTTQRPTFEGVERQGAQPYLETDFPFCIGGTVIAEKEGYHRGEVRVDTDASLLEEENTVYYDVEMIPLKEFDIDVSSVLLVDKDTKQGSRVFTEEQGSVYVSIESQEYDFNSQAIWPNEGDFLNTLSFLDHDEVTYNVSVYYLDADYGLKGLLIFEDTEFDIRTGNTIEFVIPTQSNEIDAEEYQAFNEFMREAVVTDVYGINFK